MDWRESRDALLAAVPHPPGDLLDQHGPGLYAWWDLSGALAPFWPAELLPVKTERPIYIGLARTTLALHASEMHLRSTRRSALRRALVALLVDELELRDQIAPGPGQKFGLTEEGDSLLTFWMANNLHVTWHETSDPRAEERSIVGELAPPLNDASVLNLLLLVESSAKDSK
ncbi:hypothetical protein C5C39_06805 [Rathayibacter sp. AY1F3]|uniref:GIY-YIG nuclease family protein n=1 Tax=Rathayibacter sp. AY1F3 TaxID=2080558 RepID=UPI000CE7FAC9|nr:hypothetical protein [Rathayibacter sp. AY1F3]PPG91536.1 hypothetical protein C5C39_06805 [Rathayibacter sp. AY1F3]